MRQVVSQALDIRRKVWSKLSIFALEGLLLPLRPMSMIRLGSYYGGWWIPDVAAKGSVAVCVGAGQDVTFDLELLRLGYRVYTVDPTPAAVDYVRTSAPDLTLIPVGLWDTTGSVSFSQNGEWADSWAISDTAVGSESGISSRMQVKTVRDLLGDLGVSEVSILKIDIEGAEHLVIRSMLADDVLPHTLCIEFDDHRIRRVLISHRRLRSRGYRLLQIDGFNHTYVRSADVAA